MWPDVNPLCTAQCSLHCADRTMKQVHHEKHLLPDGSQPLAAQVQRLNNDSVACVFAGMDPGARHFLWGILQRQVIAAGEWQASRVSVASCLRSLHCSKEKLCLAVFCLPWLFSSSLIHVSGMPPAALLARA